jgi:hypothetical protein
VRVLYFASGTPPKARRALDYLARRFPDAQLDIALCPELEPLLTPAELARVVYRAGTGQPRVGFLRHARRQRYDRVAVLFGGDQGYVTMKLAPFVTAPRHPIICINEADGAFEWRWANRGNVLRHLRWRLGWRPAPVRALAVEGALWLFRATLGEVLGLVAIAGSVALYAARRLVPRPGPSTRFYP